MKKRSPRRLQAVAVLLLLGAVAFTSCGQGGIPTKPEVELPGKDNPRDTTAIKIPQRFDWQQYVTRSPKLLLPVFDGKMRSVPSINVETDCVFLDDAVKPVIHLSFETVKAEVDLRLDASVTYQGFEQKKFTTLYPFKVKQRFMLPSNSLLMQDTAALTMLGSAQFPMLEAYEREEIGTKSAPKFRHNFQLSTVSNGLAYRLRLAEFGNEAWMAAKEIVVTVPACPNDLQER
jgi:hypothetical protein